MPDQVCAHTGKVIPRFLKVFLGDGNGHILILHNGVCPHRLVEQHLVVLLAVFIQTVLRHRDQDGLLKIHLIEPAVIDRDFRGSSAVKGVEKLRVFQKHRFFVVPARHSVIDVLKFECLSVLVLTNKKNTVLPDSFDGNDGLYGFGNDKFFLVLLEQRP